jgi:hypothetical protein
MLNVKEITLSRVKNLNSRETGKADLNDPPLADKLTPTGKQGHRFKRGIGEFCFYFLICGKTLNLISSTFWGNKHMVLIIESIKYYIGDGLLDLFACFHH